MWKLGYKKAEHRRIDAFELWCWRRLLRVPWTARRSNQSILKEISHEYSLEGLMLKLQTLATWWEELAHWKRPWCWERLKARGEGDDRGWNGWMASPTQWIWVCVNSRSWWWTGRPGMLQFMGSQRVGHNWATKLNWLCETVKLPIIVLCFILKYNGDPILTRLLFLTSFFTLQNLSFLIFKCSDNIDLEILYMLLAVKLNVMVATSPRYPFPWILGDYFWLVAEEFMVIFIFFNWFLLFSI